MTVRLLLEQGLDGLTRLRRTDGEPCIERATGYMLPETEESIGRAQGDQPRPDRLLSQHGQ